MATKTHDILNGWFVIERDDGTMTVRNNDKGQRIELSKESVDLFRKIVKECEGT